MPWYQQKRYSDEGFFYENIIHFLHCLHIQPLKEYAKDFLPPNELKLVSLDTSFDELITINLDELPLSEDISFIHLSAFIFINSCFEKMRERELLKPTPLLDFFRHVRNASSHNGIFKFKYNEPSRDARWNNFIINKNLEGKKLFEFITIGDLLLLIQDIEYEVFPSGKWEKGFYFDY